VIPGKSKEEVLISCHVCHPSLCNDNLSGIAVATFLGKHLMGQEPQLSYRILFPVTIGAIAWLALNEAVVNNRVYINRSPKCEPQLVGGLLLFSGAQLHSSVPNTSGKTRFSIDFRTVHGGDVASRIGAPNVDSACTGSSLRNFFRVSDFAKLTEELIRPRENVRDLYR
jgi:hypothetical protein